MMRTVHLHGRLKKQFGASHRFDVATAGEALRALNCAFPGKFVEALQTGSYKLVRGSKSSGHNISDMNLISELRLGLADLHLIPAAKGASNTKGVAKTVLGVALIGGAIFFSGGTLAAPLSMLSNAVLPGIGITWGNIAMVGLGLTLMGASSLMAKPTATSANSDADKSSTLSGVAGNGGQGDAIQLIYGETLVSGVVVSFDSDIENVGSYTGTDNLYGSIRTLFGS
jgi:predicted phage tail protein